MDVPGGILVPDQGKDRPVDGRAAALIELAEGRLIPGLGAPDQLRRNVNALLLFHTSFPVLPRFAVFCVVL